MDGTIFFCSILTFTLFLFIQRLSNSLNIKMHNDATSFDEFVLFHFYIHESVMFPIKLTQ